MKFVSIIIPIRNEELFIHTSLSAVLKQDYPTEYMEVLVVDGMSTDGTRQMIQGMVELYPAISVRLLDNPGKIVATGLNVALREAKGDVIIRVDGHTLIAPDYVQQCIKTFERTNVDNVGGRMIAIGNSPFGIAVALATSTPFGVGDSRFHYSNIEELVDSVYMGAWPRGVFEKTGLFDEELIRDQDDEFNYRLRAAGGKILLSPKIKSRYIVRNTPLTLWMQYYQYGYWKVRVLQKHPRQMSLRQFIPPLFVFALIASGLFYLIISILNIQSFIFLSSLSMLVPALYLIANLGVSLWLAVRHRVFAVLYLPLVFLILHLGYGLGFLVGLIKFSNRWKDKQGKTPTFVEFISNE